ncbi:MAG: thiol:disulfide interchange protein DsbA/DsbL [Steroidobacteraceae bacterium]
MLNYVQRLALVIMMGWGMSTMAATSTTDAAVEGTDYTLLSPAQPTSDPKKIVVTEFFSYQCPHCYVFYPLVTSWAAKLPKDVLFERVPVSLGRTAWMPVAQAFYALSAMDKVEQMDRLIFSAIHTQRVSLYDEDSVTKFLTKQGVDAAKFTAAYNSFGVKSSMVAAEQKMKSHKVQGTPAMVVNGKYLIKAEGTNGYEDLLQRTDRVIALARAEQSRK